MHLFMLVLVAIAVATSVAGMVGVLLSIRRAPVAVETRHGFRIVRPEYDRF